MMHSLSFGGSALGFVCVRLMLAGMVLLASGNWVLGGGPAAAQTLRRTDPGHLQGVPPGTYQAPRSYPTPRFHKPHRDPFASGVIWLAQGKFAERAKSDGPLSRACREGLLKRVAGGFADFNDMRVPAAPPRGMVNRSGIVLDYPIYFFRYESSSNCQVFVPQ